MYYEIIASVFLLITFRKYLFEINIYLFKIKMVFKN